MEKGWIKLHRSIQEHWLFTENRAFSRYEAWIDMLLKVNHDKSKSVIGNSIIRCERGQSILSLDSWAKRWRWNKSAVRRFFALLEKDDMIVVENVSKTTRITICNYDSYQGLRNDNETITQQKRTDNATNLKLTGTEQETESTSIKELKNVNNENNIKIEESFSFGANAQKKSSSDLFDDSKPQEEKKERDFGKPEFRQTLIDVGADPQHVDDWIKVRTAKRASFTATALQLLFDECTKHNFPVSEAVKMCAGRSWQGFKHQWYLNEVNNGKQTPITAGQDRQERISSVQRMGDLARKIVENAINNGS